MSQTTATITTIEAINHIHQEQIKLLLDTIQELKQDRPTRIKVIVNGSARWIREADITEALFIDWLDADSLDLTVK